MKLDETNVFWRLGLAAVVLGLSLQLTGCPAVVVAGAAGAGAGYYAGQKSNRSMGQVVDDAAITTSVNARFVKDNLVRARDIDVDTHKGIVTLNGRVSSRAARDRAIKLSKGVVGVRKVVVKLRITP